MRQTKWATHKFTKDEKRAQSIWRRCDQERLEINQALKIITWDASRKELHARLDRRLDTIEKGQARAQEMFPQVGESFTVAKMTIGL